MNIDTKPITDQIISFLSNVDGVTVASAFRGYPWILVGAHLYPALVVQPPSISQRSAPLYGVDYILQYQVYYVIKVDNYPASGVANPVVDMENIQSKLVGAIWDDPSLGDRDIIEFCSASASQQNDLNGWARDLKQPYVFSELDLQIIGATTV